MKTMKRQTKIIGTIGPTSRQEETLVQMVREGMDVARLNFSHGQLEQHQQVIDTIRRINKRMKSDVKILQDLEGYRIRIGHLGEAWNLKKGSLVQMAGEELGDPQVIPLEFDGDINAITPGMNVYVDDGRIFLRVRAVQDQRLELIVEQGGILKERKGVNIPDLKLSANILTDKDREDIAFGIRNQVDFIAQSFVRNKQDIARVAQKVRPHLPECRIIAKIETRSGLRNLSGIIEGCDGIMIARGDLGVSLPIYEIPLIQKDIIRRCNKRKKPVITATQMLESMVEEVRPTRAEVSDVANAILDGTDYVMLSGETAAGLFPVQSVSMMRQIIEYTEKSMYFLS